MTIHLLVLFAATTLPNVSPSASGLPGSSLVTQALSWILWLSIVAVVGYFFVNVAKLAAANRSQNYAMHNAAKQGVLITAVAALLLGAGQVLIYGLFGLASAAH